MPLRITNHHAAATLLAGATVILLSLPQSHEPGRYIVRDLGTLGGSYSFAAAINARGRVVGDSPPRGDEPIHGFVAGGEKMRDLGTLGGENSRAQGLNERGQVVGLSQLPNTDKVRAFVRDREGMREIGTLGGDSSVARDINNDGVVVGTAQVTGNKSAHAFRYENGKMEDISPGNDFSTATAINSRNQIIGYFIWREQKKLCAYLIQGEGYRILPSLGGSATFALGLNERGLVVGTGTTADERSEHAFVYNNATGKTTDLGTLGGLYSEARGVNDTGQIIGFSTLKGDEENVHAFLVEDGNMVDLNTRLQNSDGYEIATAFGINDAGQIAATGGRGETVHALRLDPVKQNALTPGAASLLLLAVGGACVAGGVNRRRKQMPSTNG